MRLGERNARVVFGTDSGGGGTVRRMGIGPTATILFVGAGVSQAGAIAQARGEGIRVVAVDGDDRAVGLREADVGLVVDILDVEAVTRVAKEHAIDGVMTVAADRAVPVVAAVAETLGLPGIGVRTAHVMRDKVAMRLRLAEHDVPQPPYARVTTLGEARAAALSIGLPAVLKPADSGGQRGLARIETIDQLTKAFPETLAVSLSREAILESFCPGLELNGIVVVRDGRPLVLTFSDRLRPPGIGFGVGWAHVFPASIDDETNAEAERVSVAAIDACGLRDGIAFPQLLVAADGTVRLIEIAARIPAGQMADLVRHAVGVDLVPVALRQALGRPVPDDLVLPCRRQPLAITFLTAAPGPLPVGVVRSVGPLTEALAQPGVVQAATYIEIGETIRPVALDVDRRGYVLALGGTPAEALERAEHAARLIPVEVDRSAAIA